jgi:nitroreductase
MTMDTFEAIKTRRSIRKYKSAPVSDEDLQKVLEAAHWAPSWANTQCWRFIVVRAPEIKTAVADSLMKVKFDDEWLDNAAAGAIKQAPILIVACAEMGIAGYRSDGTPATDKGDWLMFDVALVMENMTLAARALGLGTVIVGAFDAKKAAEILGVPEGYCVVTMTPLGFPDHTGQAPPRKALSDTVFYDRYGK